MVLVSLEPVSDGHQLTDISIWNSGDNIGHHVENLFIVLRLICQLTVLIQNT